MDIMNAETGKLYGLWSDKLAVDGGCGWWCDQRGIVFHTPYFSVALAQLDLVEDRIDELHSPWQIRDINEWRFEMDDDEALSGFYEFYEPDHDDQDE